jgi:hypothetical protein
MKSDLSMGAFALGLAVLTLMQPGFAGDEPVDTVQPVFIPPLVMPDLVVPTTAVAALPATVAPVGEVVTPESTQAIITALGDAGQFCARIALREYAVDCLSSRLATVQDSLPSTGEYADVKAALATASVKLNQLARQNADRALPRGIARTTGPNPQATRRALTPVDSAKLDQVNLQAIAILQEAETILLRSSQASEARRIPFQQIAAAVDSNKVLLRSL